MTLFLIGGSQRTGTTLLQSILCSDQLTNQFIGEASYFRALIDSYLVGQNEFEASEKYVFKSLAKLQQFSRHMLESYLKVLSDSHPSAQHFILKEPHLSFYFSIIFQLLKEVKFLIMVRDPRDTLASMLQVKNKLIAQNMSHFFVQASFIQLIQHYNSFYQHTLGIENSSFQVKCLYIKYEDLVSFTDATLNKVRLFTGLPLKVFNKKEPWTEEASNSFQTPSAWVTPNYFKGINTDSIGLYKKTLKASELYQIQQECRWIMDKFGYE